MLWRSEKAGDWSRLDEILKGEWANTLFPPLSVKGTGGILKCVELRPALTCSLDAADTVPDLDILFLILTSNSQFSSSYQTNTRKK